MHARRRWKKRSQISGDGANEWTEEKIIFLGGSDPTLSGLGAAQRLRRRGSLPPKLSSRFRRSVAGRVDGRKPNQVESLTAEEMKRWP